MAAGQPSARKQAQRNRLDAIARPVGAGPIRGSRAHVDDGAGVAVTGAVERWFYDALAVEDRQAATPRAP
jgi:hypothetical protein